MGAGVIIKKIQKYVSMKHNIFYRHFKFKWGQN